MKPQNILLALAAVLTFSAVSFAQPPFLLESDSGRYLVHSVDGEPVITKLADLRVVTWGDAPDEPDDPNKLAADVARWAKAVGDTDGAQKYALVFATVRDAVSDGKLDRLTIFEALSRSADTVLGESWSTFRQQLTEHTTRVSQEGGLDSKVELINYAAAVKHGLELAADGADAISLDESVKVLAVTNKMIDEVSR